jgi:hypothetical protein
MRSSSTTTFRPACSVSDSPSRIRADRNRRRISSLSPDFEPLQTSTRFCPYQSVSSASVHETSERRRLPAASRPKLPETAPTVQELREANAPSRAIPGEQCIEFYVSARLNSVVSTACSFRIGAGSVTKFPSRSITREPSVGLASSACVDLLPDLVERCLFKSDCWRKLIRFSIDFCWVC